MKVPDPDSDDSDGPTTGEFNSYPFDIEWVGHDADFDALLPHDSLNDLIGTQGKKKGQNKLQPPRNTSDIALRLGYYLARELTEHGYAENSPEWNKELPGPANASVVEGVCGRMKWHWRRANNTRMRDEVLRSLCTLAHTAVEPREALWGPDFTAWCRRRETFLQKGGDRNEEQEDQRLAELEADHLLRKSRATKKETTAARRRAVGFVKTKKALKALSQKDLHEQAYIRNLSQSVPGWQKMKKSALVDEVFKIKTRQAFHPGDDAADSESVASDAAWSDSIEGVYSQASQDDPSGSESCPSASEPEPEPEPMPAPKRRKKGVTFDLGGLDL